MGLGDAMVEAFLRAIVVASTRLPPDVKRALTEAFEREEGLAKLQLRNILCNVELAEATERPLCSDTGIVHVYVKVGSRFPGIAMVREAVTRAVERAVELGYLRPNAVDPFTNTNTGTGVGRGTPEVLVEVVEGETLEAIVVLKGGGSEYVTHVEVLKPAQGPEAIRDVVLRAVLKAGAAPCPPLVVGVGVGGSVSAALELAKRAATVRKVRTGNEERALDELEKSLLEEVNGLGIGPMGVGGRTTALAVHVDHASRHPALLPVAVSFSCWANRRALVRVMPDGAYEVTQ